MLNWSILLYDVYQNVFKRNEHTAQKVCQLSTLWLNQLLGGRIKIHAKLACLVEQKLSHTRTPSLKHPPSITSNFSFCFYWDDVNRCLKKVTWLRAKASISAVRSSPLRFSLTEQHSRLLNLAWSTESFERCKTIRMCAVNEITIY